MGAIQEGIYYREGERPGKFFVLACLSAADQADAASVHACMAGLWAVYQGLKAGRIPDLPGVAVPTGELTVTLGYGSNAFRIDGSVSRPDELGPQHQFLAARTSGGGPLLPGAGLQYEAHVVKNRATEAVIVQFIANTELAVQRALLETWKYLHDQQRETGDAPLYLASSYSGFQRDDGRSWIDFHDGVSNLRSGEEREQAIAIKTGAYAGGSYLCFIRLNVAIARWRQLSRPNQELLVGRDKVTGCPIVARTPEGVPVPKQGCPFAGTGGIGEPGNNDHREPPYVTDTALRQSHVQRANLQHNQAVADPQSLRIYRQGYEFMESATGDPPFELGLNFVSFQDTPARVFRLLTRAGWLGNTNFGGAVAGGADAVELLKVSAAGVYLVPPLDDADAFPGASIFAGG
ncbi:Dyp-type peroxidase [Pseudoduganella namucuonensis]|uniref:Deferrochelatase/peroxidase EfeB n=1 Tax=Pseudoduganella namucuonensis TaxID=1035707 RepID=A0A1I7IYL3_9BURK|nr:Dyp-type peroxidase domain-containing protein [Pseudoduganella namucuonensis]SFU78026.1 deferrochelatase/peroxidase EfeB [Pseudoduganella namucuonensis]